MLGVVRKLNCSHRCIQRLRMRTLRGACAGQAAMKRAVCSAACSVRNTKNSLGYAVIAE